MEPELPQRPSNNGLIGAVLGVVALAILVGGYFVYERYFNMTLAGDWSKVGPKIEGTWKNTVESFTITASPRQYSEDIRRQVGRAGDKELPFQSICYFRQEGDYVDVRPCGKNDPYCEHEGHPRSEYILTFLVSKIELIPFADNSPNCDVFVKRQEEKIKTKSLSYSFPFRLQSRKEWIRNGSDRYTR